jgi:hypothetical protein
MLTAMRNATLRRLVIALISVLVIFAVFAAGTGIYAAALAWWPLVLVWWHWLLAGAVAVVALGAWWLWWRLPKRQMRSITAADPERARAIAEDPARLRRTTRDQPDIESDSIEDTDIEIDPTLSFLPSTMGLSFLADVSGGIHLAASWGTYAKESAPGFPGFRKDGGTPELWFRTPGSASIDIAPADLARRDAIIRPPRHTISPREVPGRLGDRCRQPPPGRQRTACNGDPGQHRPYQQADKRELLFPVLSACQPARHESGVAVSRVPSGIWLELTMA